MEKFMAEFGQGYVQTPVISENNAVKFKMSIAGSCTLSTVKSYIKFQDERIGPTTFGNGLTLLEIDTTTNKIVNTKNYSLTSTHDVISQALITFVESVPAGRLIAFISSGKLNASQTLIDWFRKCGSRAFPEKWLIDKVDTSYSAFYITGRNVIVSEHVKYNDGKLVEDVSTPLEVIYDTFSDIGATGYPVRITEDESTYSSTGDGTSTAIRRFPTEDLVTPMSTYNLLPLDVLYLKFQMSFDAELKAIGTVRTSVRFFKSPSTSPISNTNIDIATNVPAGAWASFERYVEIPAGADGFTVVTSRTVAVGTGSIRNIVIGEITRGDSAFKPAEFGVNGIRMSYANDAANTGNTIVTLPDAQAPRAGKIYAAELREKQ